MPSASAKRSEEHPFRRRLQSKFPTPLSRSCGYPSCDQRLTVDLFARETGFKGAEYCSGHQDAANRRRKRLRSTIRDIETLLTDPQALAQSNADTAPNSRLSRAELTQWARRLSWELDGMPN